MSTQADAKKAELASDDWRVRSKRRRPDSLPYLILWRYIGPRNWIYAQSREGGEWIKWKAYKSADQRDRIFDKLMRGAGSIIEYRKSDSF